jgi:hypothetical protein
MTGVVFLDTETTGVHENRQVWEVGMIVRPDHEDPDDQDEIHFFVEVDLSEADPFGLRVGKFYDRHPLGKYLSNRDSPQKMTPGDSAKYLMKEQAAHVVAQATHGMHVVGAVPNFDTETLAPLLRGEWLTPAWHYHLIDIEALMVGFIRGHLQQPIDLPWTSSSLSAAVGVEMPSEEDLHTAMGDARWAMRVYDRIMFHD